MEKNVQADVNKLMGMVREMRENPESIAKYSQEELTALLKFTNVYGNFQQPAKESWINLSVFNQRESFLYKTIFVGQIGYLLRTLEEYEPEILDSKGKPIDIKLLSGDDVNDYRARAKFVKNEIMKFVRRNYSYDVDRHVREAFSENAKDPERLPKDKLIEKYKLEPVACTADIKTLLLTTYQGSLKAAKEMQAAIKQIVGAQESITATMTMLGNDPTLCAPLLAARASLADNEGILAKKVAMISEIYRGLVEFAVPLAQQEISAVIKLNPPVDLFYHMQRYITNHYEQVREVTCALFNEKPDVEFSIIYYGTYPDEKAAREDRKRRSEEFKADVVCVNNKGVTLLGPFKENRSRVDYYTKNTEILRRMAQQMEADYKLGKDLMDKQIKQKKKKNIDELGKDAGGIEDYMKAVGTVAEFGAKRGLSKEEQEAYEKARIVKIQGETPADAIAVEMLRFDEKGELVKDHFYTQAEAPEHMTPGSEFKEKYQPKHASDEPATMVQDSGPIDESLFVTEISEPPVESDV